jgi:hypothetical protein
MARSSRGYLRQLPRFKLSPLRPWLTRRCRRGAIDHGCAPFVTAVSGFLRHPARYDRDYVAFLNCSNRIASSRSRSGRSSIRFGLLISVPAIPLTRVPRNEPLADYPRGEFGNRVDAHQVGVEGHVVDFGQRQAVR